MFSFSVTVYELMANISMLRHNANASTLILCRENLYFYILFGL